MVRHAAKPWNPTRYTNTQLFNTTHCRHLKHFKKLTTEVFPEETEVPERACCYSLWLVSTFYMSSVGLTLCSCKMHFSLIFYDGGLILSPLIGFLSYFPLTTQNLTEFSMSWSEADRGQLIASTFERATNCSNYRRVQAVFGSSLSSAKPCIVIFCLCYSCSLFVYMVVCLCLFLFVCDCLLHTSFLIDEDVFLICHLYELCEVAVPWPLQPPFFLLSRSLYNVYFWQ